MNGYTFKRLEPGEFDVLIPLMQDCFGMTVNINYFKWKYLDNPSGPAVAFIAIAPDGEVAALHCAIPEMYSFNGKSTLIYQACDGMTHSRHRRKNLFYQLAVECYTYLRSVSELFVIGFGGDFSTPGLIKVGWIRLFDNRYYFFPKALASANIFGYPKPVHVKQLDINATHKIEHLVTKNESPAPIHTQRSMQVFNWRIKNPLHQYQILVFEKDGEKPGSYICFYPDGDKFTLFDFYFANATEGKALMGELKRRLISENRKGIITLCQQGGNFSKRLSQHGFMFNPFNKGPLSGKISFIIYADEQKMNEVKSPALWDISPVDHDAM